jgi:hypothetical protein
MPFGRPPRGWSAKLSRVEQVPERLLPLEHEDDSLTPSKITRFWLLLLSIVLIGALIGAVFFAARQVL